MVVSDIEGTSWSWKYTKCLVFKNENYQDCSRAIIKAINKRYDDSNNKELLETYSIDQWCDKIFKVYKYMIKN